MRRRPQTALDFGAQEFVDLENDTPEDIGEVDLVFESSAATSRSDLLASFVPGERW